ncbi:MAG: hypothetical protein ABIQ31_15405 [Ferruginibacter sp.]
MRKINSSLHCKKIKIMQRNFLHIESKSWTSLVMGQTGFGANHAGA